MSRVLFLRGVKCHFSVFSHSAFPWRTLRGTEFHPLVSGPHPLDDFQNPPGCSALSRVSGGPCPHPLPGSSRLPPSLRSRHSLSSFLQNPPSCPRLGGAPPLGLSRLRLPCPPRSPRPPSSSSGFLFPCQSSSPSSVSIPLPRPPASRRRLAPRRRRRPRVHWPCRLGPREPHCRAGLSERWGPGHGRPSCELEPAQGVSSLTWDLSGKGPGPHPCVSATQ